MSVALTCLGCLDSNALGAWVPPTADQDPALPQEHVELDGRSVAIHLRSFGEPDSPSACSSIIVTIGALEHS